MKKKEAILKVATVLFANNGFEGTSGHELARLTGVAEGTIFYHYKNKEGLLLAILEQTRSDILTQFEQFFENRPFASGMEMAEEVTSFYLYLAGLMEDKFLLLHRHFLYEFSESNPKFRENLEAIYNCLVDIFEKAIVTGRKMAPSMLISIHENQRSFCLLWLMGSFVSKTIICMTQAHCSTN